MTKTHTGRFGTARQIEITDKLPNWQVSVDAWLITSAMFHPLWDQYAISVISLKEEPGIPPAKIDFEGATHEFIVVTLNPEHGPYEIEKLNSGEQRFQFLLPQNIGIQFEATDDEMRQMADLAARYVVETGRLDPETANGPVIIRENWTSSLVKTLAHIRGEEHAP